MRERILKFLAALDAALVSQAPEGQRLDLYVIGKAAVILFYGGEQAGAMTSDVDVVQISHPPADKDDLRYLCDKGLLQAEKLRTSLDGAFFWETEESGDADRERAFANLNKVIAYLEGNSRDL